MAKYIVGITGASGVVYGVRLVEELLDRNHEVHLVVSNPACLVLEQEIGWSFQGNLESALHGYFPGPNIIIYNNDNIAAPLASGSFITDAMVVVPCTMSTLSAIAHGASKNLIERAADVMIKEKRPIIVVPRESPLSAIHLRNMLSLAEQGVAIVPPMPAFYHKPEKIEDIIDFVVGKILDNMKIPHDIFRRYI